jgi:NAD+ kinase
VKVAVYGRLFSDSFTPFVQEFFSKLSELKVELFIYEPFSDYLKARIDIKSECSVFTRHTEIKDNVRFLFSIGGDGTFLDATTLVRDANIPIIGVNTGRLGFLSSISINEIEVALEKIFKGQYVIDERTLLKLETSNKLFDGDNFALNELTVHKKDSSSMITIHAYLNDEYLNSYWADGLIVSTPTGSTAYSLSCGGPIILPGSDNFEITPIAPHNLNVRPIVIPDNSEVKLKLEGRGDSFLISLDSRSETIDSSIELIIKKNDFQISSVRLEPHSQLTTIRNKLNWGLDKRN